MNKERELEDEEKERKRAERKAREKEANYQVMVLERTVLFLSVITEVWYRYTEEK